MALTDKLTAIADAIREKTGSAEPLTLEQMPTQIAGITTDPTLEELTVTENGEYMPDDGVDGFSKVMVAVESGGTYTDEQIVDLISGKARELLIPDGCESIRSYMFYNTNCSVNIPESVKSIGTYAFTSNYGLTISKLPDGLVSLGGSAFSGCSNITLNELPQWLTTIPEYAFINCKKITINKIPSAVTILNTQCFSGCISITELTFKSTPTSIASSAFINCTNLMAINVPWAEGDVANAPWGATNATINYNYVEEG